jgi:sulfonate transport system substrate-binding protein
MSRIWKEARWALTALALASPAAQAAPLELHIGWAQTPGHLAPLEQELAKRHPELFPNEGKTYIAEPVFYQGGTPQITALATGDLEIAALGSTALALGVNNAGLDLRIVADVIQDGTDGHFSVSYLVRKDGPIKTIEDLKNHRLVVNAIGSSSDSPLRVMLHEHGIADKDVTVIEASFANMPAMIEDGKVDLITILPQFAGDLAKTGEYRVLFTAADAHGPMQNVHWAMRADFIAAHRAALVDFFEGHIRAVRWFLDPKNRPEALDIAEKVTKQPAEKLAYVFTKGDFYRSPDARPDIDAVQRETDEAVKMGIIAKGIEVSPAHVDLSLIADAKRRIEGK